MKIIELFEAGFEYNKKSGSMQLKQDQDERIGLFINGRLVKSVWGLEAANNLKKRDPKFKTAEIRKLG